MNGRSSVMNRASSLLLMAGLLMTALMVVGAQDLVAQRRGGGQRMQMERRIQARFDNLVQEELGLSDNQVGRLQSLVEEFRGRRLDFSQSERNTRGRVRRVGALGRGRDLSEQEAREILADMLDLSDREATLFREEQEGLLEIMSAPEVVHYIVMRQQLGDRIRALRGGGGPGRGLQGGRGPGQLRPRR